MKSFIDSYFEENHFSPTHTDRNKGKKVIAVDLDDVLADSIPSWISYVNRKIKLLLKDNRMIVCDEWIRADYEDLLEMKKEIPYYYYRMLKDGYRHSKTKANLPAKENILELFMLFKKLDFMVIIITKRKPYCEKITHEWLKRNLPFYDDLIISDNKHIEILTRFPELIFMIEDNRDIANNVASWGYYVFLLNNKYNQGELRDGVVRVASLKDVENMVEAGYYAK